MNKRLKIEMNKRVNIDIVLFKLFSSYSRKTRICNFQRKVHQLLNISTRTVKMRIITTFFFSIIIFFIIIIRLAYVQFVIGKGLTDDAVDLWTGELIFEADRGLILDRNEDPLTKNISTPSVLVTPRQIEDVENTSKSIADILNMSLEKAKSYVTQNASIVRIHPEGRKINKEQEKAIRELNVKGIYLVKDSKRDRKSTRLNSSHVAISY